MARRRHPAVLAAGCAVVVVVAGLAGAAAPPLAGATQVDPDTTILRVDLGANGDAAWTIEYWVRLDDENTTAAFESLQADVRENRSAFAARFADRMRRTVRAAENATGRGMAVRDVNVTTRRTAIPQEYGVLAYTFVWEGFAAVDGPRLRAGDAIAGLFLDDGTSLVIAWPEGYRRVEVAPTPDDEGSRSVTWRGEATFGSDEPRLVVTSAPPPTTATTTTVPPTTTTTAPPPETDGTTATTPATTSAPGPGEEGGGLPIVPMIAALLVLALAAAGGWAFRRRGRASGSDDGDGGAAATDDDPEPPEELLSNEERVLRLLEENGGRMKQQQVASELDWTDAKTSQVVGDLREAGEVEVFRLGRENVLALPEESDI